MTPGKQILDEDLFTLEDCKDPVLSIPVEGGKYTFIVPKEDWRVFILRSGKPWLMVEKGHKALTSLLFEMSELLSK